MSQDYSNHIGINGFIETVEVAPLFEALHSASPDVRIAVFEALTRLPLTPSEWGKIGKYIRRIFGMSTAVSEQLAVIRSSPWLPFRSVHGRVARLAEVGKGKLRELSQEAVDILNQPSAIQQETHEAPLRPAWAGGKPAGFTIHPTSRSIEAKATLSGDDLWARLSRVSVFEREASTLKAETMAFMVPRDLAPIAVTLLFEEALDLDSGSRGWRTHQGNDIVKWVEGMQGIFQPDLNGLFVVYLRQFKEIFAKHKTHLEPSSGKSDGTPFQFTQYGDEGGCRSFCYQIGWTVSRGGLRGLVPSLSTRLLSEDYEEQMAAAYLIADAADYISHSAAPLFGGGDAPERKFVTDFVEEDNDELAHSAQEDNLFPPFPDHDIPVVQPSPPTPQEPGEDWSLILEKEFQRMPVGRILFNPPDTIKLGVHETIEVRVTRDFHETLIQSLEGRGVPKVEQIKVGTFMRVRLSGEAFSITPLHEEDQAVPHEGFTEWSWDVVPQETGKQTLHLHVSIRIRLPFGEEKHDRPVLARDIIITVNPGYVVRTFIKTNWKWLIGTLMLPLLAWLWKSFISSA